MHKNQPIVQNGTHGGSHEISLDLVVGSFAFVFLIAPGDPADAQVPPYRLTGPVLIRPFGDSTTFGVGFANPTFCPVYLTWQSFCTAPWALGG